MNKQGYEKGRKTFIFLTAVTLILSLIETVINKFLYTEEIFILFFRLSLIFIFLYLINRGNSLAKWALVLVIFVPPTVNYLTTSIFFSDSLFEMIGLGTVGLAYLILGIFFLTSKTLDSYISYRRNEFDKE